jgi:Na+/phosphate symporter
MGWMGKHSKVPIKTNIEKLLEIFSRTKRLLNHTYVGFYQYKIELLKETEKEFAILKKDTKSLINQFIEINTKDKEEDKNIKAMISIAVHLDRIVENIESLIQTTQAMIKDGILFSDKAVKEVGHLYEGLYNKLGNVADLILTKNEVLIKHTINNLILLRKTASQYSTEHEERLISGVCSPKSTTYYLKMIDSLIEMMRHTRNIIQIIVAPSYHA